MEAVQAIALMLGAAWASGINLYAAILVLGWMGSTGQVQLPPDMQVLTDPGVMMAAGLMYGVEFFADKTPGVDTGWDAIHTFIRIPAGAIMAAGMAQGLDIGPAAELVALLLGGGIAAASHATKAGSRILINTSPEPFSNWTASIAEDISVVAGLWAALHYPWLFLLGLVLFMALVVWLLPRLWRAIKRIAAAVRRWLGGADKQQPPASDEGFSTRRANVLRELYGPASDQPPRDTPK